MRARNIFNCCDIPVGWSNRRYYIFCLNYAPADRIYTGPAFVTMIDKDVRRLLSGPN